MKRCLIAFILFVAAFNGNSQVNLQTGAAEQSFPLINFGDPKSGISSGVGLAYSSGNGLLVNEIASDIGTGWSLDAGGVIIRVQHGEPDDQQAYFTGWTSARTSDPGGVSMVLKNYPNGFMYNPNIGQGCNEGQTYYPVFSHHKVYKERIPVAGDVEQDQFVFNMNGRTGTFVIGKNGVATSLGDSKMKISFTTANMTSQGIRTTINQFVIITEDGMKYTFSEKGLANLCRYKYSGRNANGTWVVNSGDASDDEYALNRYWGYPLASDERPYIVTSWFLSSIENTNTSQKVLFYYENIYSDLVLGKYITHQRNMNAGKGGQKKRNKRGQDWLKYLGNPVNADLFSWDVNQLNRLKAASTTIVYNHSIAFTKRLTTIIMPDGGVVNFGYNLLPRADLPGENALSKIDYYLRGKKIRSYELVHGYLFKNSIRPYNYPFSSFEKKWTRLCLLSILKTGTGEDNAAEPPYKFDYYTGDAGKGSSADDMVPPQNFLAQDHWGYYNGFNSNLSLTEDHDFLSDERTQYFKTVLPKFKTPKNGYAKNGLLRKITYPTGGTLEYIYSQNIPPQNLLPAGYPTVTGGVSATETVLYNGEDQSKNVITDFDYRKSTGISSRWGDEKPTYYNFNVNKFNLKFSRLVANKPGMMYPEMATSPDMVKILGKALLSAAIGFAVQKAIEHTLLLVLGETTAASVIPVLNIIIFVYSIIKLITEFTTPLESHRYILCNVNNTGANPLSTYYSATEVRTNSPTGYNGKTVFEFTDLADYPAIVPKIEWPYIQSQRLASWAYGLPKKVTVYNKLNQVVNENSTAYSYIVSQLANQNNFNCNCASIYHESQKAKKWEDNDRTSFKLYPFQWTTPVRYFPYTGRTDMVSSSANSYTNGALYYSGSTSVITDPMTLLQKGKIIQKDRRTLMITLTYYPTDFNLPGAIDKLKQNNAIQVPISTETWQLQIRPFQGPAFQLELLNAKVTEYALYTFGTAPNTRQEVKPFRTYILKSKAPVPAIAIGMNNPNALLRVPSLYKLQSEMTYDNDGNLVQTTFDDYSMSYVNDYTSRYVVATATNASSGDIAYAGFESDGTGTWAYNPVFIKSTYSITGAKSFQLGFDPTVGSTSTITRSGLSASKTYLATYWLRYTGSESVNINGQSGQLMYTGLDGWRFYQREISGTTSLTVAGNGLVDELRLYPKGAMMSTVSFKEGIGKVTECDANNRMTYYEYDALGRLKITRDQNKNIIKTYEYNYKQ